MFDLARVTKKAPALCSTYRRAKHLRGGLGVAEVRPRKHGKAQIDGRGIQGMNGIVEIDS